MEHQTNMFNKHAAAEIKTLRQIEESCDGVYNMFYWQIFPASFSSTQRKHCGAKESPSLHPHFEPKSSEETAAKGDVILPA